MNTFSHADLIQLVEAPGDRFVSLYMPDLFGRRGVATKHDSLSKTAGGSRGVALGEKGMEKADVRQFSGGPPGIVSIGRCFGNRSTAVWPCSSHTAACECGGCPLPARSYASWRSDF